jgi:predicted AlkP superfamily pyrophosphatase or phosphodiesterase
MYKLISIVTTLIFVVTGTAQTRSTINENTVKRPKLVVGIVVDQMRWDYLYRYYDRYAPNGGFKRLLQQGFSCDNTLIPYTPTYTACGHTGIYSGSVPAITGITGNAWWDNQLNKTIYCVQDDSVKTVGSATDAGKMSPRNLNVTTICDELKLATNFRSKVIGFAIKDRGSILPSGFSADAAYWYDDKSGVWISSTYYMNNLPSWMNDFNAQKNPDKYYAAGWSTLYPVNTYTQSDPENKPYASKPFGQHFPYDLKKFTGTNYTAINATPFGNTFTFEAAKAGFIGEELAKDTITDFLAISLSSPDYIGHTFGPNSIEAEDCYLRLDKDLGDFLNFLDEKAGRGQYLLFLSADHGAAHTPGFLGDHKIPTGKMNDEPLLNDLNKVLKDKYGADNMVAEISNFQVFLNHDAINTMKKRPEEKELAQWIIDYLTKQPGVARAVDLHDLSSATLPSRLKDMIANGYYPRRSGDIQFVLQPQWLENLTGGGTTHGAWNPYDSHIPLLLFGWNIKPGNTNRQVSMTDIAPTLSALLHIQMPSGCIGQVIEEVTR